jgi:hypothetical protein
VCFVLVAALVVPTAAATAHDGRRVGLLSAPLPDAEDVLISIDLEANGTAHWQVQYRYPLESEEQTEAFEAFRRDVEANRSAYREQFRRTMDQTVRIAENQTGREMSLSDPSVTTRRQPVPQETGVVIYEITWHGFGVSDSDALTAGSVLSGFYLDPATALTMTWPATYQVSRATPSPDTKSQNRVTWAGERTFGADEPRLQLTQPGPTTKQASAGADQTTGPRTGASDGGSLVTPLVIGLLSIAVLGGGFVVVRRRGTATDDANGTPTASESGDPPEALLSNEERVLALLEANGGRMKQKAVADELGWRASKTSKVVSSLQDDGEVDVFRLGRENVLTLPDVSIDSSTEDQDDDN